MLHIPILRFACSLPAHTAGRTTTFFGEYVSCLVGSSGYTEAAVLGLRFGRSHSDLRSPWVTGLIMGSAIFYATWKISMHSGSQDLLGAIWILAAAGRP